MGNTFIFLNNNINSLFSKKMQIAMIGLDGAGKTTILYRMKLKQDVHTTMPTAAFNVDTVRPIKNLKFLVWDIAGTEDLRPLWKAYIRKADGIIFVIDSSDVKRFEEAKVELDEILLSRESKGVPLIILANKQDKKSSVSPMALTKELELDNLDHSVKWHLQPTAGRFGDGLQEAMLQLATMVNEDKYKLKDNHSNHSRIDNVSSFERDFESTQHSQFV